VRCRPRNHLVFQYFVTGQLALLRYHPFSLSFHLPMSNAPLPQPKKKLSSTMFWFLIFGGLFMTFMILCCSGAGLLAYRANLQAQKLASAQVKWKLPKEEPLPDDLVKELELAGAVTSTPDRPIQLFQDWAKKHEGMLEIDFPRFVKAMEHTGISTDINWLSNWIISQALSSSEFDLPYVNAYSHVVSADWIIEGQEARILVAFPFNTLEAGAVHAIWVVRQGDDWRVYDWKDVLEPLTNAEYMAVYYGEKTRYEGKMAELMEEINEIFESGKTDETKANAIWQATNRTTVDPVYREYANFQACQYILALNQMDKLEQVLRELPERSNLGRKFLRLRLAIHKVSEGTISNEDFFLRAKQFVSGTGWYPGLGRTLMQHAKTDADCEFAKSLLIKDLVLNDSIHYGAYQHFHSAKDANLIWEQLRQFPNAASKLAMLANGGLQNDVLESLAELAAKDERTTDASTYLNAIRAIRAEQWDKALPDLENLYHKELLGNGVEQQLKSFYAQALLRSGRLKESMASADDENEVLAIARDYLLDQYEPYEDWVSESIAHVLQAASENTEFSEHSKTILLRATGESTRGNWAACIEPLLKCHRELTTADEGDRNFHEKVLSLLAESLEQTQSWGKHRDEIESAEFVLLAFGKKHPMVTFDEEQDRGRIDQWKEMLAWYRKEASTDDNLWTSYFESKLAFETGNWEEADQRIVNSIEYAKDESQIEAVYEDAGASQFIPFEYSGELRGLRIEMAFRSKRSDEWLNKLKTSSNSHANEVDDSNGTDESLKSLPYTISSNASQTMSPGERDRLIAAMSESDLFEQDSLDWMRLEVAKTRGDMETMWEISSRYSKSVKKEVSGRKNWGTDCVLAAMASKDEGKSRLKEAAAALGKEWKAEIDIAQYMTTRDESKCPLREPKYEFWNSPLVRNWIVERKLFQNVENNDARAVRVSFSPPVPFTGTLLLNRTAADFDEKQLTAGLSTILPESKPLLRIQAESANGGVSHWRVLKDDCIILFSQFDRPNTPNSASEEPFDSSSVRYVNFQSAMSIAVIPYSDMHDGPSLLTRIAQGLSGSIETCFGYYDEQSSSLLIGEGWREKLASSNWVAIDATRPARCNVDVLPSSPHRAAPVHDSIEVGTEMTMELHWGHYTELMPVSVMACESAGSYGTYVVKFLDNSVIDPRIERGWITKTYRNSLR
jgi:hypothetical protein